MAESEFLRVIRVWASLAWADGFIAEAEAAAIKKIIELAELSDDEKSAALGYLDEQVELDTAGLEGLGTPAREGIYRAAVRLAKVDLDVAADELAVLERLRGALGIEADRARSIEAEAG